MHDLSERELRAYEALYKHQGARIKFKCDQVTYKGIIDIILPDSRQVRLRHTIVVEENKYLGNLRFRFSDFSSFTVVESVENVSRIPKNEYLLKILRNNQPVPSDSITKALYDDVLSDDEKTDEEKIVEKFVLDLPKHLECKLPKDYTLIDTVNDDFYQAVQRIASQQVIGVSFNGPVISRFDKLTWICISTEERIFLFDIQQLGENPFNKGLREVFESKSIKKVIHDCRFPSDCLAHQYATVLTNVFDTRVADFVVNIQRYCDKYEFNSFSSLDCCLRNYLGVPQEFLFQREVCDSSSNQEAFFSKRPISNAYLYDLIKDVVYLKLLHEKLSKELLAPLYNASNFYCSILAKASKEVIDTLGSELSKPDSIPPGLLMDGVQTVCLERPGRRTQLSLGCDYIDSATGKIIGPAVSMCSPSAMKNSLKSKDVNKSTVPLHNFNETSNQKSPLLKSAALKFSSCPEKNNSDKVQSLSVVPSRRHLDEVYHKLVNGMYPDQSGNAINVKPSLNYISTFSVRQPFSLCSNINLNSSENIPHTVTGKDLIESSESPINKDSEECSEMLSKTSLKFPSERAVFAPTCNKMKKIRFVPG